MKINNMLYRNNKIFLFILMVILLFQMIPSSMSFCSDFKGQPENSREFITSSVFNTDVLYIGERNTKGSIQKLQINYNPVYIQKTYLEDIAVTNVSFLEVPLDLRKIIRQSIPHYFNGSRYKVDYFAI